MRRAFVKFYGALCITEAVISVGAIRGVGVHTRGHRAKITVEVSPKKLRNIHIDHLQ